METSSSPRPCSSFLRPRLLDLLGDALLDALLGDLLGDLLGVLLGGDLLLVLDLLPTFGGDHLLSALDSDLLLLPVDPALLPRLLLLLPLATRP